jgi:sugar lactone lactonase YvrE
VTPPTATVVKGACPHDCPDTCALDVHVRDGIAIKVTGSSAHAPTAGVLCTKVARYTERTCNGNTFNFDGRELSCEHGGRRVVRYEHSGAVTVIADKFLGKRLNSPNDIVVHPYGGIWFSDPTYGTLGNHKGFKAEQELPMALYCVEPKNGRIEKIAVYVGTSGAHVA